ncbi:DpnD/PcfM family protein [Campylobacter sp. RM16190]|uniref:DpnD/PcfM family protein n=1 Tax=Campylobacter sp. RM16190 TaxID=1705727 RepID=UPI001474124F|nr:DpnD/PcfM family protein [Campylobacter sp. RM16190]
MEFEVQITETLVKKLFIKAENKEVARKIAKSAYENCEIVLNSDDFCDVEFEIKEQVELKS